MSVNAINCRAYCSPVMIEDHSNPQADAIVKRVNSEIKINQAEVKVKFLQDTLNGTDLTKPEKNAIEGMLREAQREFAQLKQQAGVR